jgi:hypothetical protein
MERILKLKIGADGSEATNALSIERTIGFTIKNYFITL